MVVKVIGALLVDIVLSRLCVTKNKYMVHKVQDDDSELYFQ